MLPTARLCLMLPPDFRKSSSVYTGGCGYVVVVMWLWLCGCGYVVMWLWLCGCGMVYGERGVTSLLHIHHYHCTTTPLTNTKQPNIHQRPLTSYVYHAFNIELKGKSNHDQHRNDGRDRLADDKSSCNHD
jgi:hypothetical protein